MRHQTFAVRTFADEVIRRARAVLGMREHPNAQTCGLCITALDIAATRGAFTEDDMVATAKQVATDTQRWR